MSNGMAGPRQRLSVVPAAGNIRACLLLLVVWPHASVPLAPDGKKFRTGGLLDRESGRSAGWPLEVPSAVAKHNGRALSQAYTKRPFKLEFFVDADPSRRPADSKYIREELMPATQNVLRRVLRECILQALCLPFVNGCSAFKELSTQLFAIVFVQTRVWCAEDEERLATIRSATLQQPKPSDRLSLVAQLGCLQWRTQRSVRSLCRTLHAPLVCSMGWLFRKVLILAWQVDQIDMQVRVPTGPIDLSVRADFTDTQNTSVFTTPLPYAERAQPFPFQFVSLWQLFCVAVLLGKCCVLLQTWHHQPALTPGDCASDVGSCSLVSLYYHFLCLAYSHCLMVTMV
jgi:hypothetical protein